MATIPRQTARPGLGGYSPRPIDPSEAHVISNLRLLRDGVWVPRGGLTTMLTFSGDVTHISHPPVYAGNPTFIVVEGGNLRGVSPPSTNTLLGTGWPTGRIRHAFGISAAGVPYWLAAKVAAGSGTGSLYKVTAGVLSTVSAAPQTGWVEAYGLYTFVTDNSRGRFSEAGDSDTWPALNDIQWPIELGPVRALIAIDESRLILFGHAGTGMLSGSSEDTWSQGQLYNLGFIAQGNSIAKCGNLVVAMGPGPRLYTFNPSLERFDGPIQEELRSISDFTLMSAWYDPTENCYCFSHPSLGKTYLFDLEKKRWMGTWDKPLVGIGLADSNTLGIRYFGWGTKLVQMDDTGVYTDGGSAFTCTLEVGPEHQQMPEGEKGLSEVYLDGRGTWDVTLLGRSTPEGTFTTIHTVTGVVAPAWVSFPLHTYRERLLRLSATASSTLCLRGLKLDERFLGVTR